MTKQSGNIIDDVLGLDGAVEHIIRSRWPESWLQINLPVGSTRALLAIEGRDARTPGRVAEALGVSRTTVTGLLDRLEREGLLTRAIDPHDRRCFVLHLTPKGQDLITGIEENRRQQIKPALERMSAAELEALHTGLEALVREMKNPNDTPHNTKHTQE